MHPFNKNMSDTVNRHYETLVNTSLDISNNNSATLKELSGPVDFYVYFNEMIRDKVVPDAAFLIVNCLVVSAMRRKRG